MQDPYGMGYKGVDFALKSLAGEEIPQIVDTGATAVTKDKMDEPAMKELLNPLSRAK